MNPKKKPNYNPDRDMENLMTSVASAYGTYDDRTDPYFHEPTLRDIGDAFGLNIIKVRKFLISAGVYSTSKSRMVAKLVASGFSLPEIMEKTGLSRASVNSYIPYESYAYKMPERSVDADRGKLYRARKDAVKKLCEHSGEKQKDLLWNCIEVFEGYRFEIKDDEADRAFSYKVDGDTILISDDGNVVKVKRCDIEKSYVDVMSGGDGEMDAYISSIFQRFGVL